jgi:hypothetical protein
MVGRNKSNATLAILLLLIAVLGCKALGSWSLTDTKWRGTNPDLDGDFIIEFHSGSTATITANLTGKPARTFPANWSADSKNVTVTWSTGRFEGTVKGKEIEGNISPPGGGTSIPMTFRQE